MVLRITIKCYFKYYFYFVYLIMLNLKNTPNGKLVSSRELHIEIAFMHTHYLRWARMNIKEFGLNNRDYFENTIVKNGRTLPDTLISIEFAKSICYMNRTKRALKIREWLFEYELTTTN